MKKVLERTEIDPDLLATMEHTGQAIADVIGQACSAVFPKGPQPVFVLWLMSPDGPESTYVANVNRQDMLVALQELMDAVRKHEDIPPTQTLKEQG